MAKAKLHISDMLLEVCKASGTKGVKDILRQVFFFFFYETFICFRFFFFFFVIKDILRHLFF